MCDDCGKSFSRKDSLKRHQAKHAEPKPEIPAATVQPERHLPEPDPPMPPDELPYSTVMNNLVRRHWNQLRTNYRLNNRIQDAFTFRFDHFSVENIEQLLVTIFETQSQQFKLNMAVSFAMRNTVTDEVGVFYVPPNIGNRRDLDKVMEKLEREDVLEYCRQQRPASHWVVEAIIGMTVYVNKLWFPLG